MTEMTRRQAKIAKRNAEHAAFMAERDRLRHIEHERNFYYAKALYERDKDKALENGDLTQEQCDEIEAKIAEVEKEIKDYHDSKDKS
jgi:predicted secreted Zn-dependent protease